jgi:23S rRNA-/tRNA-specific pseudouridylate synthase
MMNPLIRTPGRHLRRSAYSHCWLSTSPTPSLTHSSTRMSAIPRIVFENNHALVIDKPIGIAHHSNDDEDGIMKTMRSLQSEAGGDDVYSGDLYSVHRLDRDTSGLLLFAKTKSAASFFSKQFADRKVIKYCKYALKKYSAVP